MAEQKTSGGVGFLGLLCLLFIALKLTGYVQWEWLWVLAPLWIPFAVLAVVAVVGLLIYVGAALFLALAEKKK